MKYPSREGIYKKVEHNEMEIGTAIKHLNTKFPSASNAESSQLANFDLSKGQQALWTVYKLFPNATAYNIPMAYQLNLDFDAEAFFHALQSVVNKHPSLRTIFKDDGDNSSVQQYIQESLEVPVHHVTINDDSNEALMNNMKREAYKPFILEEGPLINASVYYVEKKPAAILINIHHIIFDGMSMQILMKDLQDFYVQWKANNEIPQFQKESKSFKDFVIWEDGLIGSDNGKSSKEYWLNSLKETLPQVDLPFTKNEKETIKFKGANYSIPIEKDLLEDLKDFSFGHSHSLYSIMLSAYSLLLKKYTEETIVIGIPMANRVKAKFEDVIGLFMNMTILENRVENEDTFLSLVKRNESKLYEVMEHCSYPLHQLSIDANKSKLFNTAFYYQNWVGDIEKINTKENSFLGEPILDIHQQGEFDLTLEIIESDEKSSICFKYNPSVYDRLIIEKLAQHYINLLKNVLVSPDHKLSSFQVLTQEEITNTIYKWNDNEFNYDSNCCTHELFEEMALLHPNAKAISVGEATMTYSELDNYSNRLANHLNRLGVKQGDLIGVYLTRNPKLLASLFAIHKAGAAYVPLDPIYPKDRLEYMINHSELKYVITESQLSKDLSIDGITQIKLDSSSIDIDTESAIVLNKYSIAMEDTAYVIYTSGSTGQPKGVEVLHKGLSNFLSYMRKKLDIHPSEKFYSLTTICFDIVGLELFLPLISGASVEVGTDEDIRDGLAIKKIVEEKNIDVMQGTPSNWRMIKESGWIPKSHMKLLVGGERVDEDIKQFLTQQNSKVWNVYGPTETTIWSTISSLTNHSPITIGRPIGNTKVYILNSSLIPVPNGAVGELYIAGDGLAKGYYKNNELTQKNFIPNPMIPNSIMYKTGDLVRYLKNGEIEYIGRSDQQVKLRGFRMELGEIETLIKLNSNINEAVVVLRNNKQNVPQLVGFIKQEKIGYKEFVEQLLQSLSSKLPEYMIPSKIITVSQFPLTLNQKIDRKLLRDLDEDTIRSTFEINTDLENLTSEAPEVITDSYLQKAMENSLVEIISSTNNIERLDVDTSLNIGEYGFDSISYTKLAKIISEKYEIDIKPNIFYQYSTIESLAQHFVSHYQEKLEAPLSLLLKSEARIGSNSKLKMKISKNAPTFTDEPIAIVGMWGKMPKSHDLDEFWDSLIKDKDLIEVVPASRWDWRVYEGNPLKEENKISSKWGGFIPDIDKFDHTFFGISPYEANSMDPQQKLILESVWKTIENAGHKPSDLSGSATGVFIGSSGSDFMGNIGTEIGNYTLTGIARSVLANRVSYLLNLSGPSEPVDTACSSGLVAIHRAITAIRNGECEQAIAGAVNVITSPFASIAASKVGMLSVDGRCKAFDSSANGYVRGEGVATVLLKPLSKALEDHDYVYGVVRGSAVNHGGKANSFTAPNPNAQADLLLKAYQKAGVNPSTVSYIEAHGTGTELGDPIETDGLRSAFNLLYKEWGIEGSNQPHCGIGSVKSNIGHLEAAAGMAGFIKILLSMQNEMLTSNIHLKEKNPYINLDQSPFYLVGKKEKWDALKDDNQNDVPRIAGVSSFGFGGSNAHIVLEEYEHKLKLNNDENSYIVPISAQNEDELRVVASDLRNFLTNEKPAKQKTLYTIRNISYTLTVGRQSMKSRFSTVVSTVEELVDRLDQFLESKDNDLFFTYTLKKRESHTGLLKKQEIDDLVSEKKLEKIAYQWTKGNFNLNILYKVEENKSFQRLPLPAYALMGEPYSLVRSNQKNESVERHDAKHPMLNQYELLTENVYSLSLTGDEYFIRDHVVNLQKVMPGVAYLETSLAAYKNISPQNKVNLIKNIVWSKPLIFKGESHQNLEIHFDENKQADFSYIFKSQEDILTSGKLAYKENLEKHPPLDLAAIEERCTHKKNGDDCYQLFKENDFDYGPSFQVIENINHSDTDSLALINLPADNKQIKGYTLHPSIMDGALQTIILLLGERDNQELLLPFAIEEVQIHQSLLEKCYVYGVLRKDTGMVRKYDIYLTDLSGNILVYIKNYSLRMLKKPEKDKVQPIHYYQPTWIKSIGETKQDAYTKNEIEIVFDNNPSRYSEWISKDNVILVKWGDNFNQEDSMIYSIDPMNYKDYELLIENIKKELSYIPEKISIFWALSSAGFTLDQKLTYSAEGVFLLAKTIISRGVKRADISYVYDCESSDQSVLFDQALSGLAKTINIEQPGVSVRCIGIESITENANKLYALIQKERALKSKEVRYINGERYISSIVKVKNQKPLNNDSLFIDDGVYVISGGTGVIGLFLAENIAQQAKRPNLFLLGRSELSLELKERLEYLEKLGANINYLQIDVSKSEEVQRAFEIIKDKHEQITSVYHAAGMIKDSFILNKPLKNFRQVIKPKVFGVINLEKAIKAFNVEYFILFSSITSITGNIGQSDYAYANSFLNEFAEWMENRKDTTVKTISISWPLWKNGGMKVDNTITEMMEKEWGILPLSDEHALNTINIATKQNMNHIIPMEGDAMKIEKSLQIEEVKEDKKNETPDINHEPVFNQQELQKLTVDYLKEIISNATEVPKFKIDEEEPFEVYGIDSVMILKLNSELESLFGDISKTLFFEYQNTADLANYFIEDHSTQLVELLGLNNSSEKVSEQIERAEQEGHSRDNKTTDVIQTKKTENLESEQIEKPKEHVENKSSSSFNHQTLDDDIAIIGIDGQYPMAKNLDEFWENLKEGKDCITEIPSDRWDYKKYYTELKGERGKTYSKWGGFLEDIDKFDPLFFNISPLEAQMLDPQERLFIQTVWHTIEDAGYTRKKLVNKNVGVYVGAMWGQYQLYGGEIEEGVVVTPTSSYASIANRVSYFFDFNGPSLTLDTMCSSSLTTIHLACESIRNGEIDMAIAGGVNLTVHPNKHIFLSQTKFASSDGLCRSFGEGGDGYVPGEGVGAVLLKPLKKAIEDNDQIYSVIKGSVVNHGGKTNGYTVPNPKAQESLIEKALIKSGVDPRTISYIEAHGTGTALGDPIEINGISKAFGKYTNDKNYCAIGSVKSNIGHCESAAGIAGITKMILQLKHKQLVPSIHSEVLNPNINFKETPFSVQQKLEDWIQPVVTVDNLEVSVPRRAGISSFGAGGANAHIILEEYVPSIVEIEEEPSRQLLVLSARNKEQLNEYAKEMVDFLSQQQNPIRLFQFSEENDSKGQAILNIKNAIFEELSNVLTVSQSDLDIYSSFNEYGMDHFELKALSKTLKAKYNLNLDINIEDNISSILEQVNPPKTMSRKNSSSKVLFSDLAYTLQSGREEMEERLAIVASSEDEAIEKLLEYYKGNKNSTDFHQNNINQSIGETGFLFSGKEGMNFIKDLILNKKLDKLAHLWVSGIQIDWDLLNGKLPKKKVTAPKYPFAKERCWVTDDFPLIKGNTNIHPFVHEIDANQSLIKGGVVYKTSLSDGIKEKITNRYSFKVLILETIKASLEHVNENVAIQDLELFQPNIVSSEDNYLYIHLERKDGLTKFNISLYKEEKTLARGIAKYDGQLLADNPIAISNLFDRTKDGITETYSKDGLKIESKYTDREMVIEWKIDNKSQDYYYDSTVVSEVLKIIENCFGMNIEEGLRNINAISSFRDLGTKGLIYVQKERDQIVNITFINDNGDICSKFDKCSYKDNNNLVLERFFYKPTWKEIELESEVKPVQENKKVLIIEHENSFNDLVKELKKNHLNDLVYTARPSDKTELLTDNSWEMEPTLEGITHLLTKTEDINVIYFLGGLSSNLETDSKDISTFEESQDKGVIQLYRVVKALEMVLPDKAVELKVITNNVHAITEGEAIYPYSASLIGFSKSLAKEYKSITVSCMDIALESGHEENANFITREDTSTRVKEVAFRKGTRYERSLIPENIIHSSTSAYKENGVYFIVGGLGNVGHKLSMYLAENYKARLVLTGRSTLNDKLRKKINAIEELGGEVLYVQVDLMDHKKMEIAVEQATLQFGKIDGAIHSAMNFEYKTISDTTEELLREELGSKTIGSLILFNVLKDQNLDFLLFFSSGESFTGNVGWSSYAAGCTFKDAYASHISSLVSFPVQIINWGFWDNEQDEFTGMLRSKGIHPIQTGIGMNALERVLINKTKQIMALNVEDKVLSLMGVELPKSEDKLSEKSLETVITPKKPTVNNAVEFDLDTLQKKVESFVKGIFSKVLKLDVEKIDSNKEFSYYGVDSLIVTDIHQAFEEELNEKLLVTLLLENTTVADVTEYLLENNKEEIVGHFGGGVTEKQPNLPKSTSENEKSESQVTKEVEAPIEATGATNISTSNLDDHKIEILSVTARSKVNDMLTEYGDKYTSGTLKAIKENVINKSDMNYDPSNMYHMMVNTSFNKKIEVFSIGEGIPILLVPAIGLTAPIWTNQLEEWSDKYQLIVIHHPGYGISEVPKQITNEVVATIFKEVIQTLNINRKIHIIGSCFGGVVSQYFAKEYPELVASLTLSGSFYRNFGLPDVQMEDLTIEQMIEGASMISQGVNRDFDVVVENTVEDSRLSFIEHARELINKSQCVDPLVVMRYVTQILTLSGKEWLADIKAPTLCIAGDFDTIVDPNISQEISELVSNGTYLEIEGAGHYPYLTHTKDFDKRVLPFIEKQENMILV
ncbi:non-ribosomal peptide synthetase [Shouchella miscanthi]|uniref:non-ribosomal peptide synthetase n=1 Tax=Shouchella miscanthi TaxID=2598861 RepID=UPI0011A1A590|nr:non-ribosomal peptide synthetase [Shouchella miscanthi]